MSSRTVDHIIDLGPEGGDKGGQIIATGTPEKVAESKKSYTGYYLKPILARDRNGWHTRQLKLLKI